MELEGGVDAIDRLHINSSSRQSEAVEMPPPVVGAAVRPSVMVTCLVAALVCGIDEEGKRTKIDVKPAKASRQIFRAVI
jgi:hypothetical protein